MGVSRISPRPDAPLIYEFSEAGERDSQTLVTRGPLFVFFAQSRDFSVGETTWSLQVRVSEKGSAQLPSNSHNVSSQGEWQK